MRVGLVTADAGLRPYPPYANCRATRRVGKPKAHPP